MAFAKAGWWHFQCVDNVESNTYSAVGETLQPKARSEVLHGRCRPQTKAPPDLFYPPMCLRRIYSGWKKPFREQLEQANRTITPKLHGLGPKLQRNNDSREVLGSSLTISAKPAGVGDASQSWIPRARAVWITDAYRGDGNRFVVRAEEKLTAFVGTGSGDSR